MRLDATTDIVISEDTPILSFIEDIESLPNGDFVIASGRDRVVLYVPANASDVRQIGRAGQGPGEYLGPVLARARGDTLLVRDGSGGRTIFYRLSSGESLSKSINIQTALQDIVFGDYQLTLYYRGQREGEPFLGHYDLQNGRTTEVENTETSSEHSVLRTYAGSGGLAAKGNHVYFAAPDEPVLMKLDLTTETTTSVEIRDEDFVVNPTSPDMRNDWSATVRYITSNSRVCGILALDDYIVVQVEHGPTEEERWLKWHVFSHSLEYVDTLMMDVAMRHELGLEHNGRFLASRGNALYTTRTVNHSAGEFQWAIWQWRLSSSE